MTWLNTNSVIFRCRECGECCKVLFGKRFGAAILPEEKVRLETIAKRIGVTVDFYPLTKDLGGNVTTYQFTDKRCPFLNVHDKCMIYNWRPLLCKAYPCMPYGVGFCHSIERQYARINVRFTPEQAKLGNEYLLTVGAAIKQAMFLYNVNKHRWEYNTHVPPRLTI